MQSFYLATIDNSDQVQVLPQSEMYKVEAQKSWADYLHFSLPAESQRGK